MEKKEITFTFTGYLASLIYDMEHHGSRITDMTTEAHRATHACYDAAREYMKEHGLKYENYMLVKSAKSINTEGKRVQYMAETTIEYE